MGWKNAPWHFKKIVSAEAVEKSFHRSVGRLNLHLHAITLVLFFASFSSVSPRLSSSNRNPFTNLWLSLFLSLVLSLRSLYLCYSDDKENSLEADSVAQSSSTSIPFAKCARDGIVFEESA
jgi:hypothetical protein